MSQSSSTIWPVVLAGAVAAIIGSAEAHDLASDRVAWGYDAVPNMNFDCAQSCFGDVEIFHLNKGTYEVEMSRIYLQNPSDLQVSAAQNSAVTYCTIAGWNRGARKIVDAYVNCYDINGNPADSYFSFLYQSRGEQFGSAKRGIAYLWADQPTEASYTPNLDYQYNSTGATNTMVRNGTGSYTASIPGLTKKGGNVQVTAYGSGPARCTVSGWSASSQSGTSANVLCFDATGAAADEMFTLAYSINEPLGLFNKTGDVGLYALANKANDGKVYTPSRAYNYNGFETGPVTAQKTATGVYTLSIPGETGLGSGAIVLVTSYGTTGNFCTSGDGKEEWYPFQIFCYDQSGNPVDSKFSVSIQTNLEQ
jgi:hypothetical protein